MTAQRAQPDGPVQLIVHTPPGSGPDVMAQALVEGLVASGADQGNWEIVHRAGGNGEEAMRTLLEQPGSAKMIATCTPSFLQTPLLKGLPCSFRIGTFSWQRRAGLSRPRRRSAPE